MVVYYGRSIKDNSERCGVNPRMNRFAMAGAMPRDNFSPCVGIDPNFFGGHDCLGPNPAKVGMVIRGCFPFDIYFA